MKAITPILLCVALVCTCVLSYRSANVCKQKHGVRGPCRAYFPNYTYNAKRGRCERFIYGGCGGNRNRFRSLKKCRITCKG